MIIRRKMNIFLLQIEEENLEKREIGSSLEFENLKRESVTSL